MKYPEMLLLTTVLACYISSMEATCLIYKSVIIKPLEFKYPCLLTVKGRKENFILYGLIGKRDKVIQLTL